MNLNCCRLIVLGQLLFHFVLCFHPVERLSIAATQHELDQLPWSTSIVRLVRGGYMYIYHNYTTIESTGKTFSGAWLHREVIPHHNRVIRSRSFDGLPEHTFNKRGFILNPNVPAAEALAIPLDTVRYVTWNWLRPNLRCKIFIPFCFADEYAKIVLLPFVNAAIDMWHQALGGQRGIELKLTRGYDAWNVRENLCYDRWKNWGGNIPRDTVVITLGGDPGGFYNGCGWKRLERKGRDAGRMVLTLRPYPGDYAGTIRTIAHEIGHVLGLEHEHQRPDAGNYIEVFPYNVKGIGKLDAALAQFNQLKGLTLKKADVINSYTWMRRMYSLLRDTAPDLTQLLPMPPSVDKWEISDAQTDGPLDFDSIMIYGCWADSIDGRKPTMLKRNQGGSTGQPAWVIPLTVSSGDVRAVKRIYPDVVFGP